MQGVGFGEKASRAYWGDEVERLSITNFAGISQATLTPRGVTVLIGPQASGKSVIAKLLYFFRAIPSIAITVALEGGGQRELKSTLRDRFASYFPAQAWPKGSFELSYTINGISYSVSHSSGSTLDKIQVSYSSQIRDELSRIRKVHKAELEEMPSGASIRPEDIDAYFKIRIQPELRGYEDFFNLHETPVASRQVYVPAGRSFFVTLENSIFSFLSTSNQLDPFIRQFGAYYQEARSRIFDNLSGIVLSDRAVDRRNARIRDIIRKKAAEIIRADYQREKGREYLVGTDGRRVPLTSSSSGQQETLPLSVVLEYLATSGRPRNTVSFAYIEEPEAHLFPSAQRAAVELVSATYNSKPGLSFLVTTHSPYVLTAVNVLLQAGALYKSTGEGDTSRIREVVPRHLALEPESVSAFSINNGTLDDLIDPETQLVDPAQIDRVSSDLVRDFDRLLSIASPELYND